MKGKDGPDINLVRKDLEIASQGKAVEHELALVDFLQTMMDRLCQYLACKKTVVVEDISNPAQPRPFTPHAEKVLAAAFLSNPRPKINQMISIAEQARLTLLQVRAWFNRVHRFGPPTYLTKAILLSVSGGGGGGGGGENGASTLAPAPAPAPARTRAPQAYARFSRDAVQAMWDAYVANGYTLAGHGFKDVVQQLARDFDESEYRILTSLRKLKGRGKPRSLTGVLLACLFVIC